MPVQRYRTRRPRPGTISRRALTERRLIELRLLLGDRCVHCGRTDKLTVDHTEGWRTWEPREVHYTKRLRIYIEEARKGMCQWLCIYCNSSKGDSAEDAVPF